MSIYLYVYISYVNINKSFQSIFLLQKIHRIEENRIYKDMPFYSISIFSLSLSLFHSYITFLHCIIKCMDKYMIQQKEN